MKLFTTPCTKKINLAVLFFVLTTLSVVAQEEENKPAKSSEHYQATSVTQRVGSFKSPYESAQSFRPNDQRMTVSATYFLAYKLSKNTDVVVNPEMAGGVGLSGVFGMASFPNAEAMRTGQQAPFYYMARLFVRQTIPLTNDKVWQDDGFNTIAGYIPTERIVVTAGKFALTDYFDANSYSHDGRTQFFNWSIGTQGAYDFAADNKAYTQGIVIELIKQKYRLRYAAAQLSTEPNGPKFNPNIKEANHQILELEKPISLVPGKAGAIRVMTFVSANKYGSFADAIENGVARPFDSLRTKVQFKTGVGVNVEQALSDNAGFFARASWNNGKYETWSYTQIDESLTAGFSFNGNAWKRKADRFGFAGGINALSSLHAQYLAAGGQGIILGDGKLNYGTEKVFEAFYSYKFNDHIWLTADYQFCINPGFNRDRGPVWDILGVRAHVEF